MNFSGSRRQQRGRDSYGLPFERCYQQTGQHRMPFIFCILSIYRTLPKIFRFFPRLNFQKLAHSCILGICLMLVSKFWVNWWSLEAAHSYAHQWNVAELKKKKQKVRMKYLAGDFPPCTSGAEEINWSGRQESDSIWTSIFSSSSTTLTCEHFFLCRTKISSFHQPRAVFCGLSFSEPLRKEVF